MLDPNIYSKIIEYIDNELPPSEEPNLFSMLAQSEELRTEMREQLRISRLVSKDRTNLFPSQTVTMNILSSLGISQSQMNLNSSPFAETHKMSFLQKLKLPVVSALISSIITFLVVFFLIKQDSGDRNNLSKFQIIQTPPVIISSMENITDNTSYPKKSLNQIVNNEQSPIGLANKKFDSYSNVSKIFDETLVKFSGKNFSLKRNYQKDLDGFSNYFDLSSLSNKVGIDENNGKYSLIFRGMQGFTFPNPNLASNDALLFSNIGIGFYFLQFSRVQFGVEFGREIFGQRFINSIDDIDFYYEQKPMLYWGAVGAKFHLFDNLWGVNDLSSTATLLAGGTPIGGPLVKLLFGLNWTPESSILGMYLGLESTLLAYQNQNKYYISKKLGLTYGLMLNF
ncbi:MAG: hypothetical protein ACUVQ1_07620 [Candidatus Kapaibacteriales bacterium]